MRFLADEHIPTRLILQLRAQGHKVSRASERPLAGQPDHVLIRMAKRQHAVLITSDLGFANLRVYPPRTHPGIVVIRTRSQSAPIVTDAFLRFLRSQAARYLAGSLVIVEETQTRIRRS